MGLIIASSDTFFLLLDYVLTSICFSAFLVKLCIHTNRLSTPFKVIQSNRTFDGHISKFDTLLSVIDTKEYISTHA